MGSGIKASTVRGLPTRSTCTYSPKLMGAFGLGRTVTASRVVEAQPAMCALGSFVSVGTDPLAVAMLIGISTAIRLMLYLRSHPRRLGRPLLGPYRRCRSRPEPAGGNLENRRARRSRNRTR